MVLDYSKWDALELSDDSDIETHPNVDKRSFIRAKQSQIHQERVQRKHRIETLKYERNINDGLLARIDKLLASLKAHQADSENADEHVFDALTDLNTDFSEDTPPRPSEDVYRNVQEQPSYSKMMAALVDQVKNEVDKSKETDRYQAYVKEIGQHKAKVQDIQGKLLEELAKMEKEASKHITSDDIHTGFDSSHVRKDAKASSAKSTTGPDASSSVELLNPGAANQGSLKAGNEGQSSDTSVDVDDGPDEEPYDEEDPKPSKAGYRFAKIKFGDYPALQRFILEHPKIMNPNETDGLLVEAFNALSNGKDEYGKQCVHQALLLQYCRQLPNHDAVRMFFKRVMTADHDARKFFLDDVQKTYTRIRARTAELNAEKERAAADGDNEVETIQLHAVDPDTQLHIQVPPAQPPAELDPSSQEYAALRGARAIFDSFSPGLRRALEKGSLEEVNMVLARMSVAEAETVVEQLGEGGMLSLEKGVIDATTEEGKKQVERIERERRMPGEGDGEGEQEGEEVVREVEEAEETKLEDTVD
ncbi:MAG: hsp90 co-chaperone Cdc37 [Bathelium mastoideum]|nr:MAG: hsp90 co-chaperone Cdc37 [Bathelium mastoideum]